jgi:thymidylate synthase
MMKMQHRHYWQSDDLAQDYADILRMVRDEGSVVAPRNLTTYELLSFTLELRDPTRALPLGTGRKVHMGLAAAEALQLIGGFSDPGAMMKISPHFEAFTDGGVFHAPYGPRLKTQIPAAIHWLQQDRDTRKAYLQIWDAPQDLWCRDTRDHPCTTSIQFMIRDGRLDAHVNMRANDVWRGFPYDVFQFCQLQLAVAGCVGVPAGTYYHHATSFHLYESNYEQVADLKSNELDNDKPIEGVGTHLAPYQPWSEIQRIARGLFYGTVQPLNAGEERMFQALRKAGVEGQW